MATYNYDRAVFDVPDMEAARRIILTPEQGQDTDERWRIETPYVAEMIGEHLRPKLGGTYIDYGCGIGRVAKAMIERFNCRVLGVDISERMRALAPEYVQSDNFSAVSLQTLQGLAAGGFRADGAVAIWVLQHCLVPAREADLLRASLADGAGLFVLNANYRAIPTAEGVWFNDQQDVRALLLARFSETACGVPDPSAIPQKDVHWAAYRL
jgi:SAM-dependent methyltransferase